MIIDEVSVPFITKHAFYVAHADMKELGRSSSSSPQYILRQRSLNLDFCLRVFVQCIQLYFKEEFLRSRCSHSTRGVICISKMQGGPFCPTKKDNNSAEQFRVTTDCVLKYSAAFVSNKKENYSENGKEISLKALLHTRGYLRTQPKIKIAWSINTMPKIVCNNQSK